MRMGKFGCWAVLVAVATVAASTGAIPARAAGTATAITITLSLPRIPADDEAVSAITVKAMNFNQAVAGYPFDLTISTTGTGHPVLGATSGTTGADGSFTTTVTSSTTPETDTITAKSKPGAIPSISKSATLTEAAQVPTTPTVQLLYPRSSPNGVSTNPITVHVADTQGGAMAGVLVTMSANGDATFSSTTGRTNNSGNFAPTLVAGHTRASQVTVLATADGLTGSSAPVTFEFPRLSTIDNPNLDNAVDARIIDDRHQTVRLQGVQIFPAHAEPPLPKSGPTAVPVSSLALDPTVEGAFQYIADKRVTSPPASGTSWGFNTVRLVMTDTWWMSPDTPCADSDGPGGRYKKIIDQTVQELTGKGVIVILDLSYTTWRTSQDMQMPCLVWDANSTTPGQPMHLPMADDLALTQFWPEIAAKFATNPLVAFDLFNEPFLTSDRIAPGTDGKKVWHDGGLIKTHAQPATYVMSAGMEPMYRAVHAAAPNNLILVGGYAPTGGTGGSAGGYDISVALDKKVQLADGTTPELVYSPHPYSGGCPASSSAAGPKDLDATVGRVATKYPVVFGEFGSECGTDPVNERPDSTPSNTPMLGANFNQGILAYASATHTYNNPLDTTFNSKKFHIDGWNVFKWDAANRCAADRGQGYGIYVDDTATACGSSPIYGPSVIGGPIKTELVNLGANTTGYLLN